MTVKDPCGSPSQGASRQLVLNAWVVRLSASRLSPEHGKLWNSREASFLKTYHLLDRLLAV